MMPTPMEQASTELQHAWLPASGNTLSYRLATTSGI